MMIFHKISRLVITIITIFGYDGLFHWSRIPFGMIRLVKADSLAMFPHPTSTRQPISLDGVWNFRITDLSLNENYGFEHHWYNQSLDLIDEHYERMPVPSSYNDITEKRDIRDFVGWSWYDRKFFLPPKRSFDEDDSKTTILLRFGSVNFKAVVWLNGKHVMNHTGGHLPFQADITNFIKSSGENHISVAVNNALTPETLPQGTYKIKNDSRRANTKFIESTPGFDFFNYAGIQRSVQIYLVPKERITDLSIVTDVDKNEIGLIHYNVSVNVDMSTQKYLLRCDAYDRQGKLVASESNQNLTGTLKIENAKLWWPYTMNPNPGYLYRLKFSLIEFHIDYDSTLDEYYQMVGIRTLFVDQDKKQFLVNGQPFYFRGFGKHEEYDIRGRSLDQVMILKDFNLIKWIGANSFRTSHYPYSEPLMDEADQQGIVVIDECPAVGLTAFNSILLEQHLQTIRELIERDKNRPSVFMWSISNEANSGMATAKPYFEKVSAEARLRDPSKRPITAADNQYNKDYLPEFLDVVMINLYYGWYRDSGYIQVIQDNVVQVVSDIFERHGKPMMISEYGADTIPGMHAEPSTMFSEDYQSELLIETHKALDELRSRGFFIGEHIWNFADFMTQQTTTRVGGNKKGIFTRQRQPKASARLLRCRYWMLANITYHEEQQQGFSYCPVIQYS